MRTIVLEVPEKSCHKCEHWYSVIILSSKLTIAGYSCPYRMGRPWYYREIPENIRLIRNIDIYRKPSKACREAEGSGK